MNPSPKMAKFVLTTWAACLARQNPVSTKREPGLHEDHEDRADDHPQQVQVPAEYDHGIGLHRRETDRERLHPLPPEDWAKVVRA